MVKILLIVLLLGALVIGFAHAELTRAEGQVIYYMDYLQEMTYTAGYTEKMPKKDIEAYLKENIQYISEAYKITPEDINLLIINEHSNIPLPPSYKGPQMPAYQERIVLKYRMEESLSRYSKKIISCAGIHNN